MLATIDAQALSSVEKQPESRSGVRRDGALASHQFADAAGWNDSKVVVGGCGFRVEVGQQDMERVQREIECDRALGALA